MSKNNFNRRTLLLGTAAVPLSSVLGQTECNAGISATIDSAAGKWDTILWDEDGRRLGSVGRVFYRLSDGSLALRLESHREQGSYNSDVYSESIQSFVIRSTDDGFTWHKYDVPLPLEECQTRLADGTLIKVYPGGAVSLEQRRKLLADVGGNPDSASREGNDLWPAVMREELAKQGYSVEQGFPGTVGTLSALSTSISRDDGKIYEYTRIEGLPKLARMFASFRRLIELKDGTILAAGFGRRRPEDAHFAFIIRSTDQGKSWSLHPVAEDATGALDFNETEILELPDGRVLAMMRVHDQRAMNGPYIGTNLHQSFSADSGATWTPVERTPIWGYPPQLIILKSGKLLCTYAHRRHPYGVRACLSHDLGKTWNYENEILIRDDSLPGLVDYPTSIQVADGTILTAYTMSKIPRLPYREDDEIAHDKGLIIHARQRVGDKGVWHGGYHAFAGLSRYTEQYVRAPGQVTRSTMWDKSEQDGRVEDNS